MWGKSMIIQGNAFLPTQKIIIRRIVIYMNYSLQLRICFYASLLYILNTGGRLNLNVFGHFLWPKCNNQSSRQETIAVPTKCYRLQLGRSVHCLPHWKLVLMNMLVPLKNHHHPLRVSGVNLCIFWNLLRVQNQKESILRRHSIVTNVDARSRAIMEWNPY